MAATIKSARTALGILAQQRLDEEGVIAYGVLKLFVDQQEQKQLKRENVMRNFNELSPAQKKQIINKFALPDNHNNLKVDGNLVPFQRIGGALVACTVKNNNFHVHGNKQNGRG